ncbi:hypothetical protein RUND412_002657 [Rhizina undulata]
MEHFDRKFGSFGKLQSDQVSQTAAARSTRSGLSPHNVTPSNSHASTPPIAVPPHTAGRHLDHHHDGGLENIGGGGGGDGSKFMDLLSPIEAAARARQSSISFETHMRDSLRQIPSQGIQPKPVHGDTVVKKEYFETGQSPQSNESESFPFGRFFPMPGKPREGGRVSGSRSVSGGSVRERRNTLAHRLLQPESIDELSPLREPVASLTSDSTMSPVSEDFHTPPSPRNAFSSLFSSPANCSSLNDSLSLGETSAWPGPHTKLSVTSRNKSFTGFDPRARSTARRRRTYDDRSSFSPGSSTPLSPASMFLNNFNTAGVTQQVEPDSEGQEVGTYVLGKQIGSGGFSIVKEAFTIEDDIEIKRAVKIVRKRVRKKDSENDKVQAEFDKEVSIWRCLSHPNILQLIAVYDTPFATFAFMQLNTGGTLYDLIKKNRQGISARLAQRYAFQLAEAIRYLHEDMRIIHRDVKLENCLVDVSVDEEDGGNLLLCDFGMAEFMKGAQDDDDDDDDDVDDDNSSDSQRSFSSRRRRGTESSDISCSSFTGSMQYASPEVIATTTPMYSAAGDIWAYAVVLYALFTGALPFNHTFLPKLTMLIGKGEWDARKVRSCRGLVEAGEDETEKVIEVLKGCLRIDPEKRWSIRRVLESEWFEDLAGDSS